MVLIYILIASVALVPSLLWVAIVITPIVTLFFYGFFTLGTAMLMDPFVKDSGACRRAHAWPLPDFTRPAPNRSGARRL